MMLQCVELIPHQPLITDVIESNETDLSINLCSP